MFQQKSNVVEDFSEECKELVANCDKLPALWHLIVTAFPIHTTIIYTFGFKYSNYYLIILICKCNIMHASFNETSYQILKVFNLTIISLPGLPFWQHTWGAFSIFGGECTALILFRHTFKNIFIEYLIESLLFGAYRL